MKSALIFVTFFSISLANDLFIGEWKEDPYKRENTNNFLHARGELFSRKKLKFVVSVLRNQCTIILNKYFFRCWIFQ